MADTRNNEITFYDFWKSYVLRCLSNVEADSEVMKEKYLQVKKVPKAFRK